MSQRLGSVNTAWRIHATAECLGKWARVRELMRGAWDVATRRVLKLVLSSSVLLLGLSDCRAVSAEDLTAGLNDRELKQLRESVDRGLAWLSTQQNADGSFDAEAGPATYPTSFAIMAFLSRGHHPERGRYGRQLSRAIDFTLGTQRADGSFSTRPPDQLPHTRAHPLTGLALSEVPGAVGGNQSQRVATAIQSALAYSRLMQQVPKQSAIYRGGWDYGDGQGRYSAHISTSSTTCWELMFMRSAQQAGFKVPQAWIDEGLDFIARCYKKGPSIVSDRRLLVAADQAVFQFYPRPPPGRPIWSNFTTTSAGVLALTLHGRRDDAMIGPAADWLAKHPIPRQGTIPNFYFSCYMTSHAMAQVGGERWQTCFPKVVARLLSHQDPAGHWRIDQAVPWDEEDELGPAFHTAVAILCLTLPDQLLPIHQR